MIGDTPKRESWLPVLALAFAMFTLGTTFHIHPTPDVAPVVSCEPYKGE